MARKCVIKTCTNSKASTKNKTCSNSKASTQNVMFHKFPANESRRDGWLVNMQVLANQMKPVHRDAIICSDHFHKDVYIKKPGGRLWLSNTAKPTIFGDMGQCWSAIEKLEDVGDSKSYVCDIENAARRSYPIEDVGSKIHFCDNDKIAKNCDPIKVEYDADDSKSHFCDTENVAAASDPIRLEWDASDSKSHFRETEDIQNDYDPAKVKCEAESIIPDIEEDINPLSSSYSNIVNIDKDFPPKNNSVIIQCHSQSTNNLAILQSERAYMQSGKIIQPQFQSRIKCIRYPGDMTDLPNMSRQQVETCVLMCKKKLKSQASTIDALTRKVKNKHRQIEALRSLVKELKKTSGQSTLQNLST